MYWEETKPDDAFIVPDDVLDIVFDIACKSLPVDHAYALFAALSRELPWLDTEANAGVHPIHVAESGNGWTRPEKPGDLLHLSRRTKLTLRLPKTRVAAGKQLIGKTLDVGGFALSIVGATTRPLNAIHTIFSRYIAIDTADDESEFLHQVATRLGTMGIKPQKMMCGRAVHIGTPTETIHARSLMLANLSLDESIRLQLHGLGPGRQLGCGLFIGHKDINEIRQKSG